MDIYFYYIKKDYIEILKKYEREQIEHTTKANERSAETYKQKTLY